MSLFRRGFYSLTNGILQTTICMCVFLRFLSVEVPDNYLILYIKIFLRNCIVDNKNICAIIILPSG